MKFLDLDEAALSAQYLERFLSEHQGGSADVYFALGRVRQKQDKTSMAAEAYQQAIKSDPGYRKAYVQLGHLLLDKRSFAAADRILSQAVKLDRQDPDTVVLAAMARIGLERFEDAAKLCRFALAQQPEHPTALYNLAFSLQQLKQHAQAVDYYRRLLEISPGWAMASNNVAWILATTPDDAVRNGAGAAAIARKLCNSETGATQPVFWMTLAAALAEEGSYDDAITTAERALKFASPAMGGLKEKIVSQIKHYRQGNALRE